MKSYPKGETMKEYNFNEIEFKNHLLVNRKTGECYETSIEIKKITNLSLKAKGYRTMYIAKDGILESILLDGCNPAITLGICRNIAIDGTLKHTQKFYAEDLGLSERTVQNHWRILKKYRLIVQVGKTTHVNPYVALPYNVKDEHANLLQQQWDALLVTKGTVE